MAPVAVAGLEVVGARGQDLVRRWPRHALRTGLDGRVEQPTVATPDLEDRAQRTLEPVVGEGRVGLRHVGDGGVGAEPTDRELRRLGEFAADTEPGGRRGERLGTDVAADLGEHRVHGSVQALAQREAAVGRPARVRGAPAGVAQLPLAVGAGRRVDALRGLAGLERGEVGDRLERRSRPAAGLHRQVELGGGVVATAVPGKDVAGVGVDRHGAGIDPRPVLLERQLCLDRGLECGHGVRLDRGAHAQRPGQHLLLAVRLGQQAADVLDDVGVRTRRAGALDQAEVAGLGRADLGRRGEPGRLHAVEQRIATGPCTVGVLDRVAHRWCGQQLGQRRTLGEREFGRGDAEVGDRRCLDATGTLAEVGGVEVLLEDLVLAQSALERDREHSLLDLALQRHVVTDEGVLDVLLGQRRAALVDRAGAHVDPDGAHEGEGIDAGVLVELRVLGRHDRVLRGLTDSRQSDRCPIDLGREAGDLGPVGRGDDRRTAQGRWLRDVPRDREGGPDHDRTDGPDTEHRREPDPQDANQQRPPAAESLGGRCCHHITSRGGEGVGPGGFPAASSNERVDDR